MRYRIQINWSFLVTCVSLIVRWLWSQLMFCSSKKEGLNRIEEKRMRCTHLHFFFQQQHSSTASTSTDCRNCEEPEFCAEKCFSGVWECESCIGFSSLRLLLLLLLLSPVCCLLYHQTEAAGPCFCCRRINALFLLHSLLSHLFLSLLTDQTHSCSALIPIIVSIPFLLFSPLSFPTIAWLLSQLEDDPFRCEGWLMWLIREQSPIISFFPLVLSLDLRDVCRRRE